MDPEEGLLVRVAARAVGAVLRVHPPEVPCLSSARHNNTPPWPASRPARTKSSSGRAAFAPSAALTSTYPCTTKSLPLSSSGAMLVICSSIDSGVENAAATASKTPWSAVVVAGKPSSSAAMRLTVLRQSGESGASTATRLRYCLRQIEGVAGGSRGRCRAAKYQGMRDLAFRQVAILALMHPGTDACAPL